jgi:hypothetical protein
MVIVRKVWLSPTEQIGFTKGGRMNMPCGDCKGASGGEGVSCVCISHVPLHSLSIELLEPPNKLFRAALVKAVYSTFLQDSPTLEGLRSAWRGQSAVSLFEGIESSWAACKVWYHKVSSFLDIALKLTKYM